MPIVGEFEWGTTAIYYDDLLEKHIYSSYPLSPNTKMSFGEALGKDEKKKKKTPLALWEQL